jgi:hypothetical protein
VSAPLAVESVAEDVLEKGRHRAKVKICNYANLFVENQSPEQVIISHSPRSPIVGMGAFVS